MKLGLSGVEARKLLKKFGVNEIRRKKRASVFGMFVSQFSSPLILILIVAAAVSFGVGYLPDQDSHFVDSVLILIIVLISGFSGFFQEFKAEKSIEALSKMSMPKVRVIRDGEEIEVVVVEIVPGDVVLLEAGDIVPADAKLIESYDLKVDESSLTGESKEVSKKVLDKVFMNTFVYNGSAKALILKTGMKTKIGEIASKLEEIVEEKSLFEKEISMLSRKIFWMIAGIIIIIFAVGFLKYDLYRSLLLSISLAVAAIPEGLAAVVILALAIGAKTMASKNALIRKLSVVESVGSIDVICTDKTGTITKNQMTVTDLYVDGKVVLVEEVKKKDADKFRKLFVCGTLCNNSKISHDENGVRYLGDPTEIALNEVASRFDISKEGLGEDYVKVNEFSFSSDRKMMSVVFEKNGKKAVYSKGAPEVLLDKCDRIYFNGKVRKIDLKDKEKILRQNGKFASDGLRVLGFAFRDAGFCKGVEDKLIWLGLQAMIDPPHEEVRDVLKSCRSAGIRVVMITGDNALTAKAIADKVGLKSKGILSGVDLDRMNDGELRKELKKGVNIFARTTPFHKLKILEILQKDFRVAMTGDGVNDSLALKKADVGISMNLKGTEVAKGASDMILLDDNFSSIVAAVREGRKIFDNIRKFMNYLLVCNLAEVGVLFLATLFLTLKEPILLPVQLLWINLLTDGMPALALGVDPARKNIMKEPPRKKGVGIIDKKLAWLIGLIGVKKMAILFATFFVVWKFAGVEQARAALFTGFVLYEFVRIASLRYQDKLGWFSNMWLVWALVGSLILQLIVVYSPLAGYFGVVALGFFGWGVLGVGILLAYWGAILVTKYVVWFVGD